MSEGRTAGRGAITRGRILAAADEVVAEAGFRRARVDAIARRAGVAIGTLYGYFPTRAALMAELNERRQRQALEAVRSPGAPADGGAAGALRAAFWAIVERARDGADRTVRPIGRIDGRWYRALVSVQSAALAEAMRDGVVPEGDPEELAWAIVAMADFAATRFMEGEAAPDPGPDGLEALARAALGASGLAG